MREYDAFGRLDRLMGEGFRLYLTRLLGILGALRALRRELSRALKSGFYFGFIKSSHPWASFIEVRAEKRYY